MSNVASVGAKVLVNVLSLRFLSVAIFGFVLVSMWTAPTHSQPVYQVVAGETR